MPRHIQLLLRLQWTLSVCHVYPEWLLFCRTSSLSLRQHRHLCLRHRSPLCTCSSPAMGSWGRCTGTRQRRRAQLLQGHLQASSHTNTCSHRRQATSPSCLQILRLLCLPSPRALPCQVSAPLIVPLFAVRRHVRIQQKDALHFDADCVQVMWQPQAPL